VYRVATRKKGRLVVTINPDRLYEIVGRTLLKYIFRRPIYQRAKRIVIVLSSIFNAPRHKAIEKMLRGYLKQHTSAQFFIYFHATKADLNCQIADYCGWAIAIKWERKEMRSYELIQEHVRSEFDIFELGTTKYY